MKKPTKKVEETECFIGSGNVYKDLGYSNPEEMQAKAALAQQIYEAIKARKLTQVQAAALMGIDQPKISEIIRGRISKYTLDRLT